MEIRWAASEVVRSWPILTQSGEDGDCGEVLLAHLAPNSLSSHRFISRGGEAASGARGGSGEVRSWVGREVMVTCFGRTHSAAEVIAGGKVSDGTGRYRIAISIQHGVQRE